MAAIVFCEKPLLQNLIYGIIANWNAYGLFSAGDVAYYTYLESSYLACVKLNGTFIVRP